MPKILKITIKQEIGSRIHLLRLKNGMSQSELGRQLGVSFQQIQKYENGTNTVSSARLQTLCNILHCTPADVIAPITTEHTERKGRRILAQLSHRALRYAIRIDKLDHSQQRALDRIIAALEENSQ
jgi:transcriptional regulator with XRE-family HTH domain